MLLPLACLAFVSGGVAEQWLRLPSGASATPLDLIVEEQVQRVRMIGQGLAQDVAGYQRNPQILFADMQDICSRHIATTPVPEGSHVIVTLMDREVPFGMSPTRPPSSISRHSPSGPAPACWMKQSSFPDMHVTGRIDAVAPQAPVRIEFSWPANQFHAIVHLRVSLSGAANRHAWPRHNKKPRRAYMSRRNSCRNSFLPLVWWLSSLWALAPSIPAIPKRLPHPSRCRHRCMSNLSRSRPRSTDRRSCDPGSKRRETFASGHVCENGHPAVMACKSGRAGGSGWPNTFASSTVSERGCCRALAHVTPGGIIPVETQDRRCSCQKLQSWSPLVQRSFLGRVPSTRPRRNPCRPRSCLNRFRPRNTDTITSTAPARRAPVAPMPSCNERGSSC